MRADELRFLLDFDAWAMDRALATAEQLEDGEFYREAGPGQVAPRETILHCLTGMRWWLQRLRGGPAPEPLLEDNYPTVEAVRALWETEHGLLEQYVAQRTEPELAQVLEQRRPDRILRSERWQFIVHLVLHNMQHRSELAQALTFLGHSPGELGLTAYLQQRGG